MKAIERLLKQKWSSADWLDQLPVAIYSCDLAGRILQYNRRAATLWGQEPELGSEEQKFCGAHRLYTMSGQVLEHANTPMARVLQTGEPARDEKVRIERPDGTHLTALVNIDPLVDEDGTLVGAVNCFQDVSELERAHETQLTERRRLSEILGALPAAIYTTDAEGRVTYFNEAATALAGRRPTLGEDRWCVTLRLFTPDGTPLPHVECPMARAITTQIALSGEEAIAERPDGTRVPFLAYPTPLFDGNGALAGAVNMLVDISDRKKAEDAQQLLINELNHRVKNTLATVQSIARQTLRRSRNLEEFVSGFSGRVTALANAHTLLTRHTWAGAELRQTLESQLGHVEVPDDRIHLSGPKVMLDPQQAMHMSLVVHELWTNACKYGALSGSLGRVSIEWCVEVTGPRADLRIRWRESGGPEVHAPLRRGFGSALIEKTLNAEQGKFELNYDSDGLICNISMPISQRAVQSPDDDQKGSEGKRLTASEPEPRRRFQGCRVLVVEDEPFVAMDIEAMLSDQGCTVVGPVGDRDGALELARSAEFHLALLDANLGGHPVDEIAAELTRRGVPFAFASGYGRDGLPEAFRQAPLLEKPYGDRELCDILERLLSVKPDVGNRKSNT